MNLFFANQGILPKILHIVKTYFLHAVFAGGDFLYPLYFLDFDFPFSYTENRRNSKEALR